MKKITDDEIQKALECCSSDEIGICHKYPLYGECDGDVTPQLKHALDLINRKDSKIAELTEEINRQKTEIKTLQERNVILRGAVDTQKTKIENLSVDLNKKVEEIERLQKVQVEYVKAYFDEFVERLKNDISLAQLDSGLLDEVIDELVETMKNEFSTLADFTNLIKAEAIKEFAERLQSRCIEQEGCLWSSDIGAVLNEMVGEG